MNLRHLYSLVLLLCCIVCLTSAKGDGEEHLPRYYVEKTKQYFSKDQWGEGKRTLDEGLKIYPYDPDMRWLMGRYWYQRKDYDKARYHLIICVENEYGHVQAKQLLVDVEENTKHYSSAICYVNELLEVNPYWRGLWRRKIELYRKQGNEEEANRLLRRINQIYPNDSILRNDYTYSLEEAYQKQKKAGRQQQAIGPLEELLKYNTRNEQYYLDLCNLYMQQGLYEKALETTAQGVENIPSSMLLVRKRVGILSEQYRYPEAMAYLRLRMKKSNSPVLHQLYNGLLEESARAERDRDPYVLYGKIYETNKSQEALDYLLATSLSRGYDDDALYYLREAKKRKGNTKDLLYKEYVLDKRTGNERGASALLQKLYTAYPNDYDIADAMCTTRLHEAEHLMANADWADALPHALFVMRTERHDEEVQRSAMEKVVTCYTQLNRYNEALAALDSLHQRVPGYVSYLDKRAFLLDKSGRTTEALNLYYTAYRDSSDLMREMYATAYEEIAVPYIKRLMQEGATRRAYDASIRLLEVNPKSDLGLHYAINSAGLLGRYDEFGKYTNLGRTYYPNDVFYKIKQATVYDRNGAYEKSLDLLRPELENFSDSLELIGAYSHSTEYLALKYIKANRPDSAIALLDSALYYDEANRELKYTKGIAFEKEKLFDSAYVYQKFYQPAVAEVSEYNQHMKSLLNRGYSDQVGLEYLQSRYAEADVITSVATAEYTHKTPKDEYTGRINYKGLDGKAKSDLTDSEIAKGVDAGGTGIQLQGEWLHTFSSKWKGMGNLAWGSKFFPKVMANVAAIREFKNDYEGSLQLGYRRLADKRDLITLTPAVTKQWGPVWTNAKLDLMDLDSKFYWNLSGQARFYLNDDGRTHIAALAGVGSAPEMTLVDRNLLNSFSHTNTMVGLGGSLLLTQHLTLGVLGTWYTYYNQYKDFDESGNLSVSTKYRNLYNVYLQLFIHF